MSHKTPPTDSDGLVHFLVRSGYGADTGQPFVAIDTGVHVTQMHPDDARALAMNLLQAADAAESDELVIRLFIERIGADLQEAAFVLTQLRELRSEKK